MASADSVPSPIRRRLLGASRRYARRLLLPHNVLAIVLVVVLGHLVVAPLVSVALTTATWQPGDVRIRDADVEVGSFTLYHWQRMVVGPLAQAVLWRPLVNTLVIAVGVVLIVVAVGSGLAWLVVRTDLPARGLIANLAVVTYILPSWTLALAWVQVFQNSGLGLPRGFLEYYTGVQVAEWVVYGPVPIVVALGLHYFPFGFLLLSGALRTVDAQLEETAEVIGVPRWRVLARVTFPIIAPALLSVVLLAFARSIGTFGTPAILGLPGNHRVLSTQIYGLISTGRESQGFVLAIVLLVLAAVGLLLNFRLLGTRRGFATIAGKGARFRRLPLRRWRWPVAAAVLAFLGIVAVFPLVLLTWSTFMLHGGDFSLGNFSLQYWTGPSDPRYAEGNPGVLRNTEVLGAMRNTVALAVIGGLLTGLVGLAIGYVVVKVRGRWHATLIEQVSFAPLLIPSIVLGAIFLSLFGPGLGFIPALYGTFGLLLVVTVASYMPYTARAGISAMHQVSGELDEAAVVQGTSWPRRVYRILFPLTKGGFLAGSLIVMISAMRELSLFILLVTPANRLLSTITFRYIEEGTKQLSYTITVLLIVTVLVLTALVKWWQRSDLAEGLGGK
jgi:iron(III) transport system permease protein